jgi:hypothetical protein
MSSFRPSAAGNSILDDVSILGHCITQVKKKAVEGKQRKKPAIFLIGPVVVIPLAGVKPVSCGNDV